MSPDAYPGIAQRVLQQLPIIVAIEQIFVRFLAPVLIDSAKLRPFLPSFQPAPPSVPAGVAPVPGLMLAPRIEIGGQMFEPQKIRLLVAQEHYTKVVTDSGTLLLRCKISAAVDQLPDGLGMRIHRSYWIAWSYARRVVKDAPGRFSVVTAERENIPLSRDFRKAFEEQLAIQSQPEADPAPLLAVTG